MNLKDLFPQEAANRSEGKCATCGGEVGEFRDTLSEKEYGITGMCQVCQDEVYNEQED